jgi:hypothetical protein
MRTVKWNPFLSGGLLFLGGLLLWTGAARADVSSTNAAAILVFPKVVVDTTTFTNDHTDTIIQITNTADVPVNVRCFWVDANGHCSNSGRICNPVGDPLSTTCGQFEFCSPGWQETDFAFRLTPKQPISFYASEGLPDLPLSSTPTNGQFNSGSILPVSENPFVGELKCVEVDDSEQPSDRNDLKGEATIEKATDAPSVDSRGYNGIGIQAIAGQNNGDDTLCLGGDVSDNCPNGPEYNACPNILILDHFFDDATDPASPDSRRIRTHLTLVPCSEDFNLQAPITTVVQYLVFNEFEQRFSTSRSVRCFSEIVLSDIDTRAGGNGDAQSIFNVNVQGTLTGQTLIRGVADAATTYGHGLLAIAEEFHCNDPVDSLGTDPLCGTENGIGYSAAFVTQQRGTRTQADFIYLPAANPPAP